MPARHSFDYAVVRVVPHVERAEFVNAGVILLCRTLDFLGARVELDAARLLALAPDVDLEEVRRHLAAIPRIAAGGPDAGPIGRLPPAGRFHWLVSPQSTIIQPSPVHSGLCDDPPAALEHLLTRMVRLPVRDGRRGARNKETIDGVRVHLVREGGERGHDHAEPAGAAERADPGDGPGNPGCAGG